MDAAAEPTPPPKLELPDVPALPLRLIAMLLDLGVAGGVGLAIARTCGIRAADAPIGERALVMVAVALPVWLYFTWFEAAPFGRTPAKRLLGLRITDADGARITRKAAAVRALVKLAPLLLLQASLVFPTASARSSPEQVMSHPGFMLSTLLVGSWLVTALLAPNGQGVHDLIARTYVRKVARPDGA